MYAWDEKKRKANLAKHGLDFADAYLVYENPEKVTVAFAPLWRGQTTRSARHRARKGDDPNDPEAVERDWNSATIRHGLSRGPQKAPTKERVTIRLSREVVDYFRATGEGWQSRIDESLKALVKRRAKK